MTLALPGSEGDYFCGAATDDPLVHQEIVEILYHTLWETVHVFLERRQLGFDAGESAFLYPFLGQEPQETDALVFEAAASIRLKVSDDSALRARVAEEEAEDIVGAALGIRERLRARRQASSSAMAARPPMPTISPSIASSRRRVCVLSPRSRFRLSPPISPRSRTTSE